MHLAVADEETSDLTADIMGQVVLSEQDLEAREPSWCWQTRCLAPPGF